MGAKAFTQMMIVLCQPHHLLLGTDRCHGLRFGLGLETCSRHVHRVELLRGSDLHGTGPGPREYMKGAHRRPT